METGSSSKESVLFADDSKTARAAARKVLQRKYNVFEAENGDEAWAQLESHPEIELVITDIHMPDSNGFELLRNIRKSSITRISNLPVVIITGIENSSAAMSAAIKLGATDFISKPFKGVDLLCRSHSYITLNKKIRDLEAALEHEKHSHDFQKDQYEAYASRFLSFSKRHKSICAFGCIEIDVLNDIQTKHSKAVLTKIQDVIAERINKHLREEDLFSQISINRFGVVMPATSQLKSTILLLRLLDTINAMSLEISGNNYRLTAFSAVYAFNGKGDDVSCDTIREDLNDAIDRCKKKNSKIVTCGDTGVATAKDKAIEESEPVITESLHHVFNGDYHKILASHMQELSDKLSPFLQYADRQCVENPES